MADHRVREHGVRAQGVRTRLPQRRVQRGGVVTVALDDAPAVGRELRRDVHRHDVVRCGRRSARG